MTKKNQQKLSPEKQALLDSMHIEWKTHPFTQEFLKDLCNDRQILLERAENLSVTLPVSNEQILSVLAQARKLREIIDYATQISNPPKS